MVPNEEAIIAAGEASEIGPDLLSGRILELDTICDAERHARSLILKKGAASHARFSAIGIEYELGTRRPKLEEHPRGSPKGNQGEGDQA
jgi:hypothetical protein